jgi:hypothetical protein
VSGATSPDTWSLSWWADWAQIGSIVGVVLAAMAIIAGARGLARDRRATHELEVLRALTDLFLAGQDDHEKLTRSYHYLFLIAGSADLPMMRAAVNARPSDDALKTFAARHPNTPDLPETGRNAAVAQRRLEALGQDEWYHEIHDAIESRVALPRGWRWWVRAWGGR